MQVTKDLIYKTFNDLKEKHQFTCELSEEKTHNFMMEYAFEINAIVYDVKKLEETYREGLRYGVYRFGFSTFILFCLVHELGHHLDYEDNNNAFNFTNSDEYIQMELNGIEKARKIIPPDLSLEFNLFNDHIIDSYKRHFEELK